MITKDEDKLNYNQATLKPDSEDLIRNRFVLHLECPSKLVPKGLILSCMYVVSFLLVTLPCTFHCNDVLVLQ